MRVFSPVAGNDMIEIYDHVPGFPNQIVRSGIKTLNAALSFASVYILTTDQKRDRPTQPHAQRSAGRFFGDFLWTSKESYPAAGRNRRT
jgi:hypothetical protein